MKDCDFKVRTTSIPVILPQNEKEIKHSTKSMDSWWLFINVCIILYMFKLYIF